MEGNEVCVCDEGQIKRAHDACHAHLFAQTVISDGLCRTEVTNGNTSLEDPHLKKF
jgi:hypothetical protein